MGSGLYRRSWTSLPTPFISAQRLSERRSAEIFANKIKCVQGCIDACGHHFLHLLKVHSDFLNVDLQKVFANKIKWVQACIDAHGHHFQWEQGNHNVRRGPT
jgi:hypothetical protein